MIRTSVNKKHILLLEKPTSSIWEDESYCVYWEGLVFISGSLSEEESIRVFINELRKVGIKDACSILKGIYFILIEEKKRGKFYAFIDDSGLYQAFYTENLISNSFLEIIKHERFSISEFDPEAVVEFLYFGNLFSFKTFSNSIKRIQGDMILQFSNTERGLNIFKKNGSYLNSIPDNELSFDEFFKNMAISLSNRKVSIDLTGGIDSRLIALMLDHFGLEFETAISGGTSEYKDIQISKKVAELIGHPWNSTIHSISSLEEDIQEVFYITEGLYDILYYHRLYQLQKSRIERGIDTIISGVGGELFKDFWWLQDFPLYSKKFFNIERFVDLRIMSFNPMASFFAGNFSEAYQALRSKMIKELCQYILDTNTNTYDNIFFNFVMRDVAGRELTSHSYYLKCYAPFLDLDVARIGYNLSRSQRLYNMFHRRKLSSLNPLIAKIRTTENGISASFEPMIMLTDLPKYLGEKMDRVLIKLKFKKQKRFISLNHPKFYHYARELKIMKESIEILKDIDIIKKEINLEQIEDRCLGMILALGLLIKYIDSNT